MTAQHATGPAVAFRLRPDKDSRSGRVGSALTDTTASLLYRINRHGSIAHHRHFAKEYLLDKLQRTVKRSSGSSTVFPSTTSAGP